MTSIGLKNIRKTFGPAAVIKGLNLTIEPGEFFTFVGPSGCGKSTILNLIAGLEPPSGGEILFDGRSVNGLTPSERDVAMIFQSYALYPHMTVYENIAFPLRMRKEQKVHIDSEVRRVADMLGLGQYLFRKPRELSGGQRQRVALGRAVVRKPKVFLMDEPLSNLDAKLRLDMRTELKNLHRELGITTVYVTHDQGEAMGLSDRIAVLDKGALQQCASSREVYRRPANTFVAGFMGSPPMNLMACPIVAPKPLEIECLGRRMAPATDGEANGPDVVAGLRPEDIHVAAQRSEEGVEASVLVSEQAGPVQWVELQWKGTAVRGMARPDDEFRAGDRAFLGFAVGDVVVFDPRTGERI